MAKMTLARSFNGSLDSSFSTYLNLRPNHDSNTINTPRLPVPDDCEIFDAQKYFNGEGTNVNNHNQQIKEEIKPPLMRITLGSEVPRLSCSSSVDTNRFNNYRGVGARSFRSTPTVSSEASWNSQAGLLSNPPGLMKVPSIDHVVDDDDKKKKKTRFRSSNWFFRRRCSCPCTGGKSIQVVEEKNVDLKIPVRLDISSNSLQSPDNSAVFEKSPHDVPARKVELMSKSNFPASQGHRIMAPGRSYSENAVGFSFPILNHPMKLVLPPPINYSVSDDPPRESLEVFRPFDGIEQMVGNRAVARRSFTSPASDEDVASDASSDLFEIESFSTQTTTTTCPVLYRRRDSLEDDEITNSNIHLRRRLSSISIGGGSGAAGEESLFYPTECYEPSEASIDWSVTTAEGFDRASGTGLSSSDMIAGEETVSRHEQEQSRRKGGWNGLLLGCRCKKAVGVGPAIVNEDQAPSCTMVHKHVIGGRPPPPLPPCFSRPPPPPANSRLFRSFAT